MMESRVWRSAFWQAPLARASRASQPTTCSASGPRGASAARIAEAIAGATGCSAKNPPMPHIAASPLAQREIRSVTPEPLFQHEQRPHATHVAGAWRFAQPLERLRLEQAPPAEPVGRERVRDLRLQEPGEPVG